MERTSISHLLQGLLLICISGLFSGCIDSSLDNCDKQAQLIVRGFHLDGTEITRSGEMGDVLLFEYDDTGTFLSKYFIPSSDIVAGIGQSVKISPTVTKRYIAWSNITDTLRMLDFSPERSPSANRIKPLRTTDNYQTINAPIYYGQKSFIAKDLSAASTVEVRTMQAVSQIHVSLVGVSNTDNPNNYQIVIANDDQAELSFDNQILRTTNVKYSQIPIWLQSGVMMGTKDAFITLPSPTGASKTILIYKEGTLIATASQDNQGNPIAPIAGQRINLLINIRSLMSGIQIVVSDWDQIVEWKEW